MAEVDLSLAMYARFSELCNLRNLHAIFVFDYVLCSAV